MTAQARLSSALHRIEVHAGPLRDEPDFIWHVTAGEGSDDSISLWGYIKTTSFVGFGQAQVVTVTRDWAWSVASKNRKTREEFELWVQMYASEVMYDTARRALQSQAALMDFAFEIGAEAPDAQVEFLKPNPLKARTQKTISPKAQSK